MGVPICVALPMTSLQAETLGCRLFPGPCNPKLSRFTVGPASYRCQTCLFTYISPPPIQSGSGASRSGCPKLLPMGTGDICLCLCVRASARVAHQYRCELPSDEFFSRVAVCFFLIQGCLTSCLLVIFTRTREAASPRATRLSGKPMRTCSHSLPTLLRSRVSLLDVRTNAVFPLVAAKNHLMRYTIPALPESRGVLAPGIRQAQEEEVQGQHTAPYWYHPSSSAAEFLLGPSVPTLAPKHILPGFPGKARRHHQQVRSKTENVNFRS